MTTGGDDGQSVGRPDSVQVRYGGRTYERDLARCRRVLLERQMRGASGNMREFAESAGLSLAMVSAWFRGAKLGTRATTERILAGLDLDFEHVHRPVAAAREEGA